MVKYVRIYESTRNVRKWGKGERRINSLCLQGRIEGVVKFGTTWEITINTEKSKNMRIKSCKYIKNKDTEEMDKNNSFEMVLRSAASLPMVRIDRENYLRKSLGKYYDKETIQKSIDYCPAYAGITTKELHKIAKASIDYETSKVTSISALAGLPGGIAMAGTIPADLSQYFGHIIRILQKLIYLYGWEELFDDNNQMDDETANMLTLFIGVMFGVNGAATTISKISASAAQKASKTLAQKALTKGTIYPIVKKIAQALGVKMTKEIFAKTISKAIPVIGALASGTLTFVTYKPMAYKLKKYLETLKPADPEYYNQY